MSLFIFTEVQIEQLHKIFKLCGSPPEDYWKKVKPPTTFRPPPHYKPCFRESFPNLPDSATDLLATLLSLDPAYRGTATRALESEVSCHILFCRMIAMFCILTMDAEY